MDFRNRWKKSHFCHAGGPVWIPALFRAITVPWLCHTQTGVGSGSTSNWCGPASCMVQAAFCLMRFRFKSEKDLTERERQISCTAIKKLRTGDSDDGGQVLSGLDSTRHRHLVETLSTSRPRRRISERDHRAREDGLSDGNVEKSTKQESPKTPPGLKMRTGSPVSSNTLAARLLNNKQSRIFPEFCAENRHDSQEFQNSKVSLYPIRSIVDEADCRYQQR
jgi:hypothetical protein